MGALALTAACGAPPEPLPTSPPLSPVSVQPSASLPAPTFMPLTPTYNTPTYTVPTYAVPTYAVPTVTPTTTGTPGLTNSPTPTPSHAAKCSGQPTKAEILALIKGQPGIPKATLKVQDGPFCAGTWSSTTVGIAGVDADEVEPLMVVATGKGSTLTLVAAGTDVCNAQVQTTAPPGIRVLVCGF
ncbi:hypothetical protein [Actinoplanes ianthinogenes]|uniref:hypothetical protein n=1 Tax=Actinoplanes ianthinogenes TaxID=122358 RepID=UPI001E4C301D|nr:hypothetical protein [Actinoplanes ianthinogenes]